jgi:adenylate cyclase
MGTEPGRVLVVDDDALNRKMLGRALELQGYAVETAADGHRALRLLRSAGSNIELILLDVVMPEMDGYDVLQYLKSDPAYARIPVIMISALDDIASVVRCLELGADDYLPKGSDPVLLHARINSSLAKKRMADIELSYLRRLEDEEAKSEELLLNILPESIAARLKGGESVIADSFADVTVLFADLVGSTELAASISATELVERLNEIFSLFDAIAAKHGLEKIKTIGDAYLVVGGLPEPRDDHVVAVAEMALEMQAALPDLIRDAPPLRIGMHSGPVVAGVIGAHKFSYDLWGDTVNVASRMESHGIPGRIQTTPEVRTLLGDRYRFEERGPIEVKGRGTMVTHFLTGRAEPEAG